MDTNDSKSLSRKESDSPFDTNESMPLSRTDSQMECTSTSDLEKVSTFFYYINNCMLKTSCNKMCNYYRAVHHPDISKLKNFYNLVGMGQCTNMSHWATNNVKVHEDVPDSVSLKEEVRTIEPTALDAEKCR